MKSLYLLFIAMVLLSVYSCNKEKLEKKEFYGLWEPRTSIAHYPGSHTTYQPGNGNYLELTKDGILKHYAGGIVESTRKYKIYRKKITECNWNNVKEYWAIEYENGSYDEVAVKDDTLVISTPPCWMDGGISTYVRVR
ncbi:MAG: hypothetical protein QM594_15150 [Niabella sp.]